MPIETKCPECGARNKNPDELEGKKATCTKCEGRFVVGGAGSKKKADEEGVRKSAVKARGGRAVDDEDEDKPKSKSRRAGGDDEDDNPRAKSKSRRARDDEDEDDRPARQPVKKGGGGTIFWILGSIAAVLLLACGGIAGGVYYMAYQAKKAVVAKANEFQEEQRRLQEEMQKNPGGNPIGGNPIGGNPIGGNPFVGSKDPATIDDALALLKSAKPADRRTGADWLSRQALNAGRQAEVSQALDPLLDDPDLTVRDSGMTGLKVWATAVNVPAIVKNLKASQPGPLSLLATNAIAILGRVPDPSGAEAVAPFLTTVFSSGQAAQSLKAMGPVAEKAVLAYYNSPDDNAKSNARTLLTGYGTKEDLLIRQCITDLKSDNKDRRWRAAQCLNDTLKVNEPLRPEVSRALDPLLLDRDNNVASMGVKTLAKWGTKDNVPTLIRCANDQQCPIRGDAVAALGRIPDQQGAEALAKLMATVRPQAGDALIVMGQLPTGTFVPGTVKPHLQDDNRQVREEAARVLSKLTPTENVALDLILSDLKSMENQVRSPAAQKLVRMNVDAARKAEVAKALEAVIGDVTRDSNSADFAVKALATWGSKENTPTLLAVLQTPGNIANVRNSALATLTVYKDEKAIKTIIPLLLVNENRVAANKALLAYGPEFGDKIEPDVATLSLQAAPSNRGLAIECCKILGAVGTKASLPTLTKLATFAQTAKPMLKDLLDAAARADAEIKARQQP